MVLYPNKLPESERVCSGICTLVEGILLKDVISEALNDYVDAWEEKNKKIRLPKAK